jgi:hypothetical protein
VLSRPFNPRNQDWTQDAQPMPDAQEEGDPRAGWLDDFLSLFF